LQLVVLNFRVVLQEEVVHAGGSFQEFCSVFSFVFLTERLQLAEDVNAESVETEELL
jgi:hypothetical protein